MAMLFSAAGCAACGKSDSPTVGVDEFKTRLASTPEAVVLDVRTPGEFSEGHIAGAVNINWLNQQVFTAEAAKLPKEPTYFVYCRSGRRSAAACDALEKLGLKCVDLDGGIQAWQGAANQVVTD